MWNYKNIVIKKAILFGHFESMTKEVINELYSHKDSMCIIISQKRTNKILEYLRGKGFFLYKW